ncbi:L,D-transpeptidase family protein [Novosphingobium mangrovi (ex Hu et al. 2023)]|uniref:L,D-transpeptidase family protein n=1 Tax=Novosphingobium mangrovi (ex Hu et al. 2023) TaxID=2930094 RepID=UPI0022837C38|nr:L,D-transpeptidase family protein [Novosphingobium mangrovi (ex Hu et al. 2023)]
MKRHVNSLLCATGLAFALVGAAADAQTAPWSQTELAALEAAAGSLPEHGLRLLDTSVLEDARKGGDTEVITSAAQELALDLARTALMGEASARMRSGWHIADPDAEIDIAAWLARARAGGGLSSFLDALWPDHPDYAALRQAFAQETDPQRRATLARNMERWRWLPHRMERDYILVNTAAFTARLWREGAQVGSWPVIVGKVATPSPTFRAEVRGVIFNPWWNIPQSIVRENNGRFPASKGYVRTGGRWRQKPGPNNALGQMKLDMPNPYSVYMHDTPGKALFEREVRAFSHGCIRTGDALGFAATLLEGAATRAEIDAVLASRRETRLTLGKALPVYITYLTAGRAQDGPGVEVYPDIYGRDARMAAAVASSDGAMQETECALSG